MLAIVLYWPGLTCWFQKDDFAWLGLHRLVTEGRSITWALFAPLAQGTVRTLSDRVFYLSFFTLFEMNALPYRCWAFLTFGAALAMLTAVSTRLSGSRAVGFWAAVLWTVNGSLGVALSWTAAYHELLFGFTVLLGLWLLIRYIETGHRRFYVAEWAVFLLGFGVVELNVVYPAIAAVYTLCRARRIFWKISPMFLVSGAYALWHTSAVGLAHTGPYRLHWDSSMISTLFTYWKWALGPSRLMLFGIHPSFARSALTVLLTAGLAGFLAWKVARREWVILLCPAVFLIVLSPVLPLRDHISDYYLTVPVMGLAMWGGWAFASGWRSGVAARIASVALLAAYIGVSAPVGRLVAQSFHDRADRAYDLVSGVLRLADTRPGAMILLHGVDDEMLQAVVFHRPFHIFGLSDVHLAPEEAGRSGAADFVADAVEVRKALQQNRALVCAVEGRRVRDITADYLAGVKSPARWGIAAKVDAADDVVAGQLGSTWYPREGAFRWMPKHATVRLLLPKHGRWLYISGFCPAAAVAAGPLPMQVSVEGEPLPEVWITQPAAAFSFRFVLPEHLMERRSVEVAVDLGRTFSTSSDRRQLGLAFGSFEIR